MRKKGILVLVAVSMMFLFGCEVESRKQAANERTTYNTPKSYGVIENMVGQSGDPDRQKANSPSGAHGVGNAVGKEVF